MVGPPSACGFGQGPSQAQAPSSPAIWQAAPRGLWLPLKTRSFHVNESQTQPDGGGGCLWELGRKLIPVVPQVLVPDRQVGGPHAGRVLRGRGGGGGQQHRVRHVTAKPDTVLMKAPGISEGGRAGPASCVVVTRGACSRLPAVGSWVSSCPPAMVGRGGGVSPGAGQSPCQSNEGL